MMHPAGTVMQREEAVSEAAKVSYHLPLHKAFTVSFLLLARFSLI